MTETRYVECDCCGKKIYLGSTVLFVNGYCGIYCSAECFANANATFVTLGEEGAKNFHCDIKDECKANKECIHFHVCKGWYEMERDFDDFLKSSECEECIFFERKEREEN